MLAAGAAALLALAVVGISGDNRRPPYTDAAHFLDAHAGASPIVETPVVLGADTRLRSSTLSLYADRPLRLLTAGPGDTAAWRATHAGATAYSVEVAQPALVHGLGLDRLPAATKARLARLGGPDGLEVPRGRRRFAGFYPLDVRRFRGGYTGHLVRQGGHTTIDWSLGSRVPVRPGAARGAVESGAPRPRPSLSGWAADASGAGLADWVLLFAGDRLVAVSGGGLPHGPVPGSRGRAASSGGFGLVTLAPVTGRRLRAFAQSGGRAAEIPVPAAVPRGARWRRALRPADRCVPGVTRTLPGPCHARPARAISAVPPGCTRGSRAPGLAEPRPAPDGRRAARRSRRSRRPARQPRRPGGPPDHRLGPELRQRRPGDGPDLAEASGNGALRPGLRRGRGAHEERTARESSRSTRAPPAGTRRCHGLQGRAAVGAARPRSSSPASTDERDSPASVEDELDGR